MNRNKFILLVILLLAAFLRLWRLGDYPALNADEAAIGYNAYSLIQTAADEHGNPWPIHFQSFNDFKPGLYFYLVLPLVKWFGLNEWAVRLPGALLGVATVYIVYLLIKELFKDKKLEIGNWKLEILAPALLAISPWHIHFSRGGWEVNVATFFVTLGAWLFLKGNKTPKYYLFGFLSLVAALYTYHAARIVVPLLFLGIFAIFRKEIKRNLKEFIVSGLIGVLLLIPLGLDLSKGAVFSRATGVGLFADPGPIARVNEQRGEHQDLRSLPAVLLHNKPVNYTLAFLDNWSEHFGGEFLFLSGDEIQRSRVPDIGQMYLLDLLFLIVGGIGVIKVIGDSPSRKASARRGWLVILWWLVIAPAAAALTFQSPHALRAHNMAIPLVVISAFGLVSLVDWLNRNIKSKKLLVIGHWSLVILMAWQFARYQHMYWVHMAKEYPFSSQYGVKQLVNYVDKIESQYENIVVTNRYDQPYILFLFYQQFSPAKFQGDHVLTARDNFGFSTVTSFDKYRFQEINFDEIRPNYPNSLIIGTDKEIPDEANIVKEIYGTNEHLYFQVVAN